MQTKTNLQSLLEQLIKRLMTGGFSLILLVFLIFSLILLEYRNETNTALRFEKTIFDLQQLINKANLEMDISRLERQSTNLHKLSDFWRGINDTILTIEQVDRSLKLEALKELLLHLEMRHKRIIKIVIFNLDNPYEKLFDERIEPAEAILLNSLDSLINISYQSTNLMATKTAADLRSQVTKSLVLLAELSQRNSSATWQSYNKKLRQIDQNIQAIGEVAIKSPGISRAVKAFQAEYSTFNHNVESFKLLSTSNRYFDLDLHKVQANKISKAIDYEITRLNEQYFTGLKELEIKLWLMIAFSMLLILLGILYGNRLLMAWKNAFIKDIALPISAISAQSKQIATGETEVSLQSNSTVHEIVELIEAVSQIKTIVAKNNRDVAFNQRVMRYKEKINQLQSTDNNFEQLVAQSFDMIIEYSGGLAAALYLKSQAEKSALTLSNCYCISDKKLPLGQRMNEDLLQQTMKSKSPVFYNLFDERLNVESAFFTLRPSQLCLYPIEDNAQLIGVLELALPELDDSEQSHLLEVLERFAMVMVSQLNITHTKELLAVTETQKLKLSETMDEMKLQHVALQNSEAELEVQADELSIVNSQLKKQNAEAEYQQKRLAELNSTLKITSAELKKASELKSEFLSKVSHELRTPLNSIIILIQTLIRNPETLDEQQLKSLEIVNHSSQDLLELINDLLDMARIEAGEIKVHFDLYNTTDLIKRVESLFNPIAEDKQLEFIVEIAPEVPETIYTDSQRLQQVIRNLLSNAFKFTKKGSVTLSVTFKEQWFKFSVIDTGVGIKTESKNQIFEAFKQVANSDFSARQGTGLGLSISSQLVEVLGGRIELTSEFGQGSAFTILLPKSNQYPNAIDAGRLQASPSVDETNKLAQLPEIESKKEAPKTAKKWQVLGAKSKMMEGVTASKKSLERLKYCDIQAIENRSLLLEKTQGLIIVLQKSFVDKLAQPAVKDYLELISSAMPIILISTDKSLRPAKWLEILASKSLVWNKEAMSYLQNLVIQNDDVVIDAEAETKTKTDLVQDNSHDNENDNQHFEFSPGRRVLIVEDDMRSLFSMSVLMKQSGIETELADNLQLAEEKMINTNIDAVITDLVLPDGDGLSFIKFIREKPRFNETPIIVLSAKNLKEEKQKCVEAGANYYFDKPGNVPKLLAVLHQVLEHDND